MTFEEGAVRFSEEEWALLDPAQKSLHKEVMEENRGILASLGKGWDPSGHSSLFASLADPGRRNFSSSFFVSGDVGSLTRFWEKPELSTSAFSLPSAFCLPH